jgi:hypothetical protein
MFRYIEDQNQPVQGLTGLQYPNPPSNKIREGMDGLSSSLNNLPKGGQLPSMTGQGGFGGLGIGNPGSYGGEQSVGAPGGTGGAGAGGAGLAAIIAGIIMGQHEMSNATDRSYMGHESGDAFSGDFMSEPWESYALQQLGIDEPSPGEKTDAFFQTGDYGRGIASLPRTGARWFDPVGDFGYQWGQEQLGDLGGLLDPLRWGLDQLF